MGSEYVFHTLILTNVSFQKTRVVCWIWLFIVPLSYPSIKERPTVVCNPCQSSPSFTILVSLFFIINPLVFSILVNYYFQVLFPCDLRKRRAIPAQRFPGLHTSRHSELKFPYIPVWQSLHDWIWKISEFSWRRHVSLLKRFHRLPIQCSAFPLFR